MNYNDIIGFIGVLITLLAFVLNVFSVITSKSFIFLLLNFLGAGLTCYASVLINYMPFVILEGVWSLVSLVGLTRLVFKNR